MNENTGKHTKEDIQRQILAFGGRQSWNHNFKLPHGVETNPGKYTSHGKNEIKLKRLAPILKAIGLEGRTVLDVGCNEGFFSNYIFDSGGVVSGIDADGIRIEKANYILEVLGKKGDIDFREMNIYSEEFQALPVYDIGICLGFLHRVPDPYGVLMALSSKTNMLILEWKALKFGPSNEAFAYFSPKPIEVENPYGTEYWLLSFEAVERILKRLGFKYFFRVDDPKYKRAILVAGRGPGDIFKLPNQVVSNRFRAFLSHTKRYLFTILGIIRGNINS